MRTRSSALTAALSLSTLAGVAAAQQSPSAGMLRYPDVSDSHIVFLYANDLWLVPREGGAAQPLASPPGAELYPRFSPDGERIVFQGNYEGDRDLYVVGADGGAPERITHHPGTEFPTDWSDQRGIIFHISGTAGLTRQQQIHTVSPDGGLPQRLPMPYGANGAVSPDGEWIAYSPMQRDFRTWKRYRGGMASDIWLFNLETLESRQITDFEGTDTLPMWHDETVYYLSDQGAEHRLNIWAFDTNTSQRRQITSFEDWDVKFPAIGPGPEGDGEIVFQNGPELYLLDLADNSTTTVDVTIPGAKPSVRTRIVDASEQIQAGGVSATGKRAVVEARGDVWTLPAEDGPDRQITDTSGAAERDPAWSPSGKWIAYFSDASGEYNLYITQSDGRGETRRLTEFEGNYFFDIAWSPDSEKILFNDKAGQIRMVDVESGEVTEVDRDVWANRPSLSWSSDSRWIAYDKGDEDHQTSAVWIYDTESGETRQVTSGFFNDADPAFSATGDYLFYASNREFTSPTYEDVGSTFVYNDTERLIAVPLNADVENPNILESDEETWDDEEADEEDNGDGEDADNGEGEDAENGDAEEGDEDADGEDADEPASPIQGTWTGSATGLAAVGLPQDELEFTMYFLELDDGSFIGASESQGEVTEYDSVTFDPDSGALKTVRSQGPLTTTMEGTLSGEELTGTWTITGPVEASGPWTAEKVSDEVDEEKLSPDAAGKDGGPVEIDFEGIEARGWELNVAAGSFNNLASTDKGELIYNSMGQAPSVRLIDPADEDAEEKTVINGAVMIDVSGDNKKILVAQGQDRWKIVDARPGQTIDGGISPDGLNKTLDPRAEWEQLLRDAWRRQRDFFYVENMHGVDWDAVYDHYSEMLDDAATREDVGFIIAEMISELNVGHAYYGGGDLEPQPTRNVGLLGVDFEVGTERDADGDEVSGFRIARIYEGAPWDTDARNPITRHGMDVEVGDYIVRVNGARLDTARDPWAAFVETAGEATTITVADALTGDDEARNERDYTVEPLASDAYLRYRDWVESNRRYVEEASSGRIGYVHVPDTGVNGQNELFRQFYGQTGKDALIIDDRWNGGGQIPTRFIELLNRPRTNYWYRRDGKDWPWPFDSHQGPKAMLINGAAGSGGDMFPWLFRYNDLGALIGTRTWGGLVGISGVPPLIDGARVTVPNFGFYETDGTWGVEGYGVAPDMQVVDDPTKLARGADPQIDAAVDHLITEIEAEGYEPPQRPEPPNRAGFGIEEKDR